MGKKIPDARADAESEVPAAEQECPREDCGCNPGETEAIEADGSS